MFKVTVVIKEIGEYKTFKEAFTVFYNEIQKIGEAMYKQQPPEPPPEDNIKDADYKEGE